MQEEITRKKLEAIWRELELLGAEKGIHFSVVDAGPKALNRYRIAATISFSPCDTDKQKRMTGRQLKEEIRSILEQRFPGKGAAFGVDLFPPAREAILSISDRETAIREMRVGSDFFTGKEIAGRFQKEVTAGVAKRLGKGWVADAVLQSRSPARKRQEARAEKEFQAFLAKHAKGRQLPGLELLDPKKRRRRK